MEEKKSTKISLSTFFLIIAIIVIIIMGYIIYNISKEKSLAEEEINNLNNEITNLKSTINTISDAINSINSSVSNTSFKNLDLGNYTVNEVSSDEGGVSNEECGITLKENNEFTIYMGYGASLLGSYKIENNKLICNVNTFVGEEGGPVTKSINITVTFNILDTNKLELLDMPEHDDLFESHGLEEGMTYSIK